MSSWEVILILAMATMLLDAGRLSVLWAGLKRGWREFLHAFGIALKDLDDSAGDAGRSIGSIYGKAAADALTCDNQTVEFFDPHLQADNHPRKSSHSGKWIYRFLFWLTLISLVAFCFWFALGN